MAGRLKVNPEPERERERERERALNHCMHVGHTYILLLLLYILQADQCTSTEQVRNKLQAQLESAKAELEAWQNETVQLLQCTGKDTALAALKKIASRYTSVLTFILCMLPYTTQQLQRGVLRLRN